MSRDDELDRASAHTTAAAALDNPLPLGETYTPPAPDPRRVDRREGPHCQRRGCPCTHTEGCDHGWIEQPTYTDPVTKQTYTPVAPCPACRPEPHQRLRAESVNDGPRVGRRRA